MNRAGTLVQWLWEETHVPKVMGSSPSTIYWLDNFHIYLMQKMLCLFEKTKINKKEAGDFKEMNKLLSLPQLNKFPIPGSIPKQGNVQVRIPAKTRQLCQKSNWIVGWQMFSKVDLLFLLSQSKLDLIFRENNLYGLLKRLSQKRSEKSLLI